MIINGSFNWELQPGYPKYSGEENNESLTFLYTSQGIPQLPAYGTTPSNIPFASSTLAVMRLASRRVDPLPGGACEIELVYKSPEVAKIDKDGELECQHEDIDVPLEMHDDYLKKWNHELHAKKDVTSTPSWWATAEVDHVPPMGSDGTTDYIWARPGDAPKDGYALLKTPTKPGVEAFKSYAPRVTQTKYYKKQDDAERKAALDGTIQTPSDTFGFTGQWLQCGSSIRREGRWWVFKCSYLGSKKIDSDIYKTI
jgi:hypothetical protein